MAAVAAGIAADEVVGDADDARTAAVINAESNWSAI
jgi:hypothetical protein